MATFVLVHGAWFGGWCWKKLLPLLRAGGHEVFTPTLTGLGERVHLARPEIDLSTHIADVTGALTYEDLSGVILVGHSYAGMVITGVAERCRDRLAQLVYLDAFVPQAGDAMLDLLPPEARREFEVRVRDEGSGWYLRGRRPVPWEVAVREDFRVEDEADVQWMAERLVAQPFRTMQEALPSASAAAALPRTYIRCSAHASAAFDSAAALAQWAASGWRFRALPAKHAAMVTASQELAGLLLELA